MANEEDEKVAGQSVLHEISKILFIYLFILDQLEY